jgi:hypothetical protein
LIARRRVQVDPKPEMLNALRQTGYSDVVADVTKIARAIAVLRVTVDRLPKLAVAGSTLAGDFELSS